MESKEKKQVVSAIQKATNILLTVGVNPSVDELSALLGLALILGKLDKHATAVFSGNIPPAISFLEPDKTFEDTVDGLRDFIIALNKDKADHLRYKLDGDVVKIFITPYKNTIIRDTDLEFSQGDFNVELIVALGVENKADLDTAVSSHGRILHDATTVTLSAGSDKSDLGEIDWHAGSASGLSEMLVSLARDLGENLIDEQIATALMTGIVSQTERFSNNLTTSDVMKTAASLMVLGANQQLIAARLEEAEEKPVPAPEPAREERAPEPKPEDDDATVGADGSMQINHTHDDEEDPTSDEPSLAEVERHKDEVLQEELDKVIPSANVDLDELKDALPDTAPHIGSVHAEGPTHAEGQGESRRFVAKATGMDEMDEPSMGGTLNATTEQAEEDSRSAIEDDRNRVILSHNAPPAKQPDELDQPEPREEPEPQPEPAAPIPEPEPAPVPEPPREEKMPEPAPAPVRTTPPPSVEEALADLGYPAGSHPTLADLDQKTGHASTALEVDDARAAVANALDTVFSPANNPVESVGSQPLGGDLHDASAPVASPAPTPAPEIPAPVLPPIETPAGSGSTEISLPPLPPLPPLPGQEGGLPPLPSLPPLPDVGQLDAHEAERAPAESSAPSENDWQSHTVEPPASNDPTQFRIPGQN